jgi:mRNA interferase MazF
LDFTPQTGHEQAGKRPAIVISPRIYNQKTSLLIACPITSRIKGYPFEVKVKGNKIEGAVLSDQVKNLDWIARQATFIEKAKENVILEVKSKLLTLLE